MKGEAADTMVLMHPDVSQEHGSSRLTPQDPLVDGKAPLNRVQGDLHARQQLTLPRRRVLSHCLHLDPQVRVCVPQAFLRFHESLPSLRRHRLLHIALLRSQCVIGDPQGVLSRKRVERLCHRARSTASGRTKGSGNGLRAAAGRQGVGRPILPHANRRGFAPG